MYESHHIETQFNVHCNSIEMLVNVQIIDRYEYFWVLSVYVVTTISLER